MTFDVRCSYPTHPAHADQPGWNDGVLGETTVANHDGMICPGCAAYDAANPPATVTNQQTMQQRVANALAANATFLAANKPATAAQQASQAYDQAVRLTREMNAVIRLLVTQDFTDTTGT